MSDRPPTPEGAADAALGAMPPSWLHFQRRLLELVEDCSSANESLRPEEREALLRTSPASTPAPSPQSVMACFLAGLAVGLWRKHGDTDQALLELIAMMQESHPRLAAVPPLSDLDERGPDTLQDMPPLDDEPALGEPPRRVHGPFARDDGIAVLVHRRVRRPRRRVARPLRGELSHRLGRACRRGSRREAEPRGLARGP
jgi:hypothetical protein